MRNLLTATITVTLSVMASMTTISLLSRRNASQPAEMTFKWVEDNVAAESYEPENAPDPMCDPKPMFYVGDEVMLYSPYTAEFYTKDWKVSPEVYEISGVKYDKTENVFRYQLKDGAYNEWYSEDWISLPNATSFVRTWIPENPAEIGEMSIEMEKIERRMLGKALDNAARQTVIDYCLDVMNHGSPEEKADAERMIADLTKTEEEL